jgi:hypothetical protein
MNVTQILHLLINPCFKCVFNAQYYSVKCMNYEWMNFALFPLLNCGNVKFVMGKEKIKVLLRDISLAKKN